MSTALGIEVQLEADGAAAAVRVAQVQRVLDQVVRAVEFLFGFTLAAGLVVLFAAVTASVKPAKTSGPSPVEHALAQVHPDEMTPREALEALYRLKGMVKD